jgi:hypothetical protein
MGENIRMQYLDDSDEFVLYSDYPDFHNEMTLNPKPYSTDILSEAETLKLLKVKLDHHSTDNSNKLFRKWMYRLLRKLGKKPYAWG